MHSLGQITLEQTGRLATPATTIALLYAALLDLAEQAESANRQSDALIDTYAARKALEVAESALHACYGCGARLPIDPRTRAIPAHCDERGKTCSYSGALISVLAHTREGVDLIREQMPRPSWWEGRITEVARIARWEFYSTMKKEGQFPDGQAVVPTDVALKFESATVEIVRAWFEKLHRPETHLVVETPAGVDVEVRLV